MSDGKKRLRVLPEVLPAPSATPSIGPRARTLEHMRRLLAAAPIAVSVAGAACTKEETPTIRAEDDKVVKKNPPKDTTASASVSTTATVSSEPTGYAVVDPMPMPACSGVAMTITATASWSASGKEIDVTLSKPARADAKFHPPTSKKGAPSVNVGGKLASTTVVGGGLNLKIVPDAGAKAVYVYVPTDCSAGVENVFVMLDLSKPGVVTVSMSDVYAYYP